jgi:hypothetical protein
MLLPPSERFWCHGMEQLLNHLRFYTIQGIMFDFRAAPNETNSDVDSVGKLLVGLNYVLLQCYA